MQDRNKTKAQLVAELETLRQRVTELEAAAATHWRTEEALRESMATLDKEQELANLGSFVWDLRDDRLTWSRHMFKLAGLDADTFAGTLRQASTDIIHPDDQRAIQQQIEQMVAEKRTWPMQFRIVRPDGQERLLQSGSEFILDEHGTPIKCVGIHHDITERIHTEATLRALVTRQEALLAAIPDIIMEVDQNKAYTWANQAGLEFFGADVVGHEAAGYFEGEQETYGIVQPLFNGNEDVIYVESWQRRKDGQKRLLAWWCRVIKDQHGNVTGALSSARDITERKLREQELRQRNEEMERFTYAVSHDLKSPLVTIKTFLGYLAQDLAAHDEARVQKDMDYIRSAADKMSVLLGELLELSRIGRQANPPVESTLQEIVGEALELVAGRIAERGVHVEVTDAPMILYGDRPRLVSVFQNLVDNAVKFMGSQPSPRVEIGVETGGPEPVFFVRDNGVGIEPRHQTRLFDLFEKLDPGTAGTGMGLALVQRIIQVHGGKIWVESRGSGQGSTFKFTLARTRRP